MNVAATQKSNPHAAQTTEELVDKVAHEVRISKEGDTLRSSAYLPSFRAERQALKDGAAVEGLKALGTKIAEEGVSHLILHGAEHMGTRTAAMIGGGLAVGGAAVFSTLHMFKHYIADAADKAEVQRNASGNDAVNIALASVFQMPDGFRSVHFAGRYDSGEAAGRMIVALQGPDAAVVPVLRARCDAGMRAAFEAYGAVRHVAPDGRGDALVKELVRRGGGPSLAKDVAYGLGVKFVAWLMESAPAAHVAKERAALEARDARGSASPSPVQG